MFNSQKQILPGSRVRYARAYLKKSRVKKIIIIIYKSE